MGVREAIEVGRLTYRANRYKVPGKELADVGVLRTPGMNAFIDDLSRIQETDAPTMSQLVGLLAGYYDENKPQPLLKAMYGDSWRDTAKQSMEKWGDPQAIVDGLALYARLKRTEKKAPDDVEQEFELRRRLVEKARSFQQE